MVSWIGLGVERSLGGKVKRLFLPILMQLFLACSWLCPHLVLQHLNWFLEFSLRYFGPYIVKFMSVGERRVGSAVTPHHSTQGYNSFIYATDTVSSSSAMHEISLNWFLCPEFQLWPLLPSLSHHHSEHIPLIIESGKGEGKACSKVISGCEKSHLIQKCP